MSIVLLLLILLMSSQLSTRLYASEPATETLYTIPDTIAFDCSVDVTQSLNDWIASIPDGSILSFRPGCYRLDGTILVKNRHGLTFEGNGATFKAFVTPFVPESGRSKRKHFWFISSSDIQVHNLRIEGTNTEVQHTRRDLMFTHYLAQYESEHGLAFNDSHNVLVDNVAVDAVFGDGLYVGTIPGMSTNITVTNFTVSRNGRQGIAITWAENVLLDNVTVTNSRRSAIDLEPATPTWQVRNVEIRNSTLASRFGALSAHGEGGVSDVYFHDNTILDAGKPWVSAQGTSVDRRRNWRIHNNRFMEIASASIASFRFRRADNVEVVGNVNHMNPARERTAILFDDVGGSLLVTGNDFTGACLVYELRNATAAVTAYENKLSDDCIYDVPPNPVVQPLPSSDFPAPFWDSFSDTDGLDLQRHRPDIDRVGGGWQPLNLNPRAPRVPQAAIRAGQARLLEPMTGFVVDAGVSAGIVDVDWTPGAGSDDNTIILRHNPDATVQMIQVRLRNGDSQQLEIRRVADYAKSLASVPFPWVDGETYHIRIELVGPSITVFVDGEQQAQVQSPELDNGATQFGFARLRDGEHYAAFDNFLVMSTEADGELLPELESTTSPSVAPVLYLPAYTAAAFGQTVAVPIQFDGTEIASTVFSVDYDERCLGFDASDDDGDGIPDAILLNLPPDFMASVAFDVDGTAGELDFLIGTPTSSPASLPSGTLATIQLTTTCQPDPQDVQMAGVDFADQPPASFITVQGTPVAGTATGGAIAIEYGVAPGDANGDGSVDTQDLNAGVLEIFDGDGNYWLDVSAGAVETDPLGIDANQDEIVDAADPICTLLHIFNGGEACTDAPTGMGAASLQLPAIAAPREDDPIGMPVYLQGGDQAVSAVAFSVDVDPAFFYFDPTDADGNGLMDNIVLQVTDDFQATVQYDAGQGRLHLFIADFTLPLAVLPDGPLATLMLRVNPDLPVSTATIPVRFSEDSVSAGGTRGQSLPVQSENGHVHLEQNSTGLTSSLYLPLLTQ